MNQRSTLVPIILDKFLSINAGIQFPNYTGNEKRIGLQSEVSSEANVCPAILRTVRALQTLWPERGNMSETVSNPQYPFVVVRWLSTVYGKIKIDFSVVDAKPNDANNISIPIEIPFVDGKLTAKARHTVVESILKIVQVKRLRMCVVFGPEDYMYCELDGKAYPSSSNPPGGIMLDNVTARRKTFEEN